MSDCLSRIDVSECIGNTVKKNIMQAITRSRSKETEIICNAAPQKQTVHLHEEPSITLDKSKYDKILFLVDGADNLSFKKLQIIINSHAKVVQLSVSLSTAAYRISIHIGI